MGKIRLVLPVLFCVMLTACKSDQQQSVTKLVAKIDISKTKDSISNHLYGMFMENLGNEDVGNLVDDCLWAELLDDRKFFYPVNTDTLNPINRKEKINRWEPIGKVTMDSMNPYVGAHSPKIAITNTAFEGIQQSGIALEKGKSYNGRIVLKKEGNVQVTVKLLIGNDIIQQVTFDNIKCALSGCISGQEWR
ncbi:hypothetical protein GSB9_03099 [Flavobacteriaceae bacterium GSB9]|nr:hypothetical protein GSB9_03099 [Flavobacteriaceae bacterium GSB9]